MRFVYDEFEESYDPTKADSYRKRFPDPLHPTKHCEIDILDTAGQEEYAAIRDNYYRSAEGFILVYSIDDRGSFGAMEDFRAQIIRSLNDPNPPLLLVANKCDLNPMITEEEALNLLDKWTGNNKESLTKWREVSAKTNAGINEIFSEIVKLIQRKREIVMENEKMKTIKKKKKKRFCLIQ